MKSSKSYLTFPGQQDQYFPVSWKTGLAAWYVQDRGVFSATTKSRWQPLLVHLAVPSPRRVHFWPLTFRVCTADAAAVTASGFASLNWSMDFNTGPGFFASAASAAATVGEAAKVTCGSTGPRAQPAICWNSSQSYTRLAQQDHPLRASWKIGGAVWCPQASGPFSASKYH
eukprot:CAMPEP_0206412968 /NCGR_PEP_ID=MMETSP0294-20121207/34369_1 /ASSEMBLY_ACC=CAM_ASM_000327 /TAXON_ID=39354 /ORGANISM="Heterosigma akashiwo, Strain CCMP2393" /LENGTH=170 /DNA_ID=CAMNT_0053874337 /DNA_START=254 /DNA_END=766 /DNA_ORIENTATION=+